MKIPGVISDAEYANRAASLILSPQEEIRLFDPDRADRADRAAGLILELDPERANKAAGLIDDK